jgi:hypothetical protein
LWRFNLTSGVWAFLSGSTEDGDFSDFNSSSAAPAAVIDPTYWQVNSSFLYVFSGFGWVDSYETGKRGNLG